MSIQKGPSQQEIDRLLKKISYGFKDVFLLKTALTHKSAKQKSSDNFHLNNERLEFLGDAVLSLVAANFLYSEAPKLREGDLSRLRAHFVCQDNLAKKARELDLGRYLISDKAMKASGGNQTDAVLSDALEALFGAVFMDGGLNEAQKVIFLILGKPELKMPFWEKDSKTRLQELIQSQSRQAPKYVVLDKKGPAHCPDFLVGVEVDEQILASARGESLKMAAQNAANLALSMFNQNNNS